MPIVDGPQRRAAHAVLIGELQFQAARVPIVEIEPLIIPGHPIRLRTAGNDLPRRGATIVDSLYEFALAEDTNLQRALAWPAVTPRRTAPVVAFLVDQCVTAGVIGNGEI